MKSILARYPKSVVKIASGIKAIFFDIDGVLSDGRIILNDQGHETKNFHVRDGFIISPLKKAGIILGAISGRESGATTRRMAELKVDFCYQGIVDKADTCSKLIKHYKIKPREVVFIGDDINDIPVFKLVGLPVTPADAPDYVKEYAQLVTTARGGEGVFREVADLVLASKGKLEKLIQNY